MVEEVPVITDEEIVKGVADSVDSVEAERGFTKFLMAGVKGAFPAFATARFARINEQPKLAALQTVSAATEVAWLVGMAVMKEPIMLEGYLASRYASLRLEGHVVMGERKKKESAVMNKLGVDHP